jgi:hypothetical protein
MDPQACLNEMFDAIRVGDIDTAQERLFDLATWIERGGAYPALAPPITDILERRRAMVRSRRSYHFDLTCPRCGKISETVSDHRVPPPRVNCGDCLINDREIVEMKVTRVEIEIVS